MGRKTEKKSEIISKSENIPVKIDSTVEKPNEEIDLKNEKDQETEDLMEVENAKQSEDIQEITPMPEKTPFEIDTNVENPNEENDLKKENTKETEKNSEIILEKTPVEIDINMEKPNEEIESRKENTTSQETEELVTKIDKVQNILEKDPEIITKSNKSV